MWEVKTINALDTYPVRHPVLREGGPLESCAVPGDDLPETLYLGGYLQGKLTAVATFLYGSKPDWDSYIGYQLRGMAFLKEYQGQGLGMRILKSGEQALIDRGSQNLWMNARIVPVPFYENLEYQKKGEEFEIAGVGPHYLMHKRLKS